MRAVAAMAKELGLSLCVEGIETLETAKILQSMGCGRGQGYFFSEPLSAKDFANYVTQPGRQKYRDHEPARLMRRSK